MSMHSPVCGPGRESLVHRFATGKTLVGNPHTDATFLHRAKRVVDDSNPRAWSYLPLWERAAVRWGVVTVAFAYLVVLARYGVIAHFAVGVPATGLAVWRVRRYRRETVLRRHKRAIADPLEMTLRRYLDELPHNAVDVPLTYAEDNETPVIITLPPTFAGRRDPKAELVKGIAVAKLGLDDDAVTFFSAKGGECRLTIGVQPKPPRQVSFADIRDALEAAPDTRPVIGLGAGGQVVTADFQADSPHILLSAGSGGGKSVMIRSLAAQALNHGSLVVMLDVKMMSHVWCRGLPGVLYARSPEMIHNVLIAVAELGMHRFQTAADTLDFRLNDENDDVPNDDDIDVGPRIVLVCEETNSMIAKLQGYWDTTKPRGGKRVSPAIQAYSELLSMGRAARIHVLAVAQYATANSVGGGVSRENFATRCLTRATRRAWTMLAPQISPVPAMSSILGRWHVVNGDTATETQVAYLSPREARKHGRAGDSPDDSFNLESLTVSSPSSPAVMGVDQEERGSNVQPRYTLGQAIDAGILDISLDAARKARQRDREFPTGQIDGSVPMYTESELRLWTGNRPRAKAGEL